ncbi:hypothetical protein GCM10009193_09590 [Shewanella aestuarii]|nr:hypothetical protein GCM10009193_09590 [Shewanella aestuarii]
MRLYSNWGLFIYVRGLVALISAIKSIQNNFLIQSLLIHQETVNRLVIPVKIGLVTSRQFKFDY